MRSSKIRIESDGLIESRERPAGEARILHRDLNLHTAEIGVIRLGIVRSAHFDSCGLIPEQPYLHLLSDRRSDVGLQRQIVSEISIVILRPDVIPVDRI